MGCSIIFSCSKAVIETTLASSILEGEGNSPLGEMIVEGGGKVAHERCYVVGQSQRMPILGSSYSPSKPVLHSFTSETCSQPTLALQRSRSGKAK